MIGELTAQRLRRDQIDQAFPLVQASLGVPLERWRRFAARWQGEPRPADRQILAVVDDAGYILGICCHQRIDDLLHGECLTVEHLSAVDLFEGERIADVLMAELESIARTEGCRRILLHLPDPASPGYRFSTAWAKSSAGGIVAVGSTLVVRMLDA